MSNDASGNAAALDDALRQRQLAGLAALVELANYQQSQDLDGEAGLGE
jgi:hypothetical protein